MALLSPNVFAATPTPEVPLTDAATVARVKQEIADGQITDMEDVFLVAYQHLGADIEEDGMTAYSNPDGTLGFTYVVSSSKARSGHTIWEEYVLTSILIVDINGNQITDYNAVINTANTRASGGLDDIMVYATHSAHLNERLVGDGTVSGYREEVRLSYMTTTISYGTNLYSASRLEQSYEARQHNSHVPDTDLNTTVLPEARAYTWYPSGTKWYSYGPHAVGAYIKTFATIYIANSNRSFTVSTNESLYVDTSLPLKGGA